MVLFSVTRVQNRGRDLMEEVELHDVSQRNIILFASILGTIKEGVFISGTDSFPMVGDPIFSVSDSILNAIFSSTGDHLVTLGSVNNFPKSKPFLDLKGLLTSHLAILGNSGSGKSTTMRVLVDSIHAVKDKLNPLFKMFIFDLHGDYSELEFASEIYVKDCHVPLNKLSLEDWEATLLPSEKIQKMILRQAVSSISEIKDNHDIGLNDMKSALNQAIEAYKGRQSVGKSAYTQTASLMTKFDDLERRYGNENGILNVNHGQALTLKKQDDAFLNSKFFVINLEGIDDDALRMVTNYLAREIFDFNYHFDRTDRNNMPFNYLYLDEAHRYVRKYEGETTIFEKIAREGRKFNVYLGVISQVPSELSPVVMGMIGSYFIHRIQNAIDIDFIRRNVPSATAELMMRLPNLPVGTALLSGSSFKIPFELSVNCGEYGNSSSSLNPIIKEKDKCDAK